MREYTSNDPVFSESISVTETSDPAHADNINRAPMQIFQNTLCNRKAIEEVEKRAGSTPEYSEDESEVYKIGVYRLHNGVLYRCIKDTSGEWDAECWQQTDALEEIGTVANRVTGIENPEFDDSGVVESIKSFPDFLETIKSKMNPFRFLRDMKAGFQFVLHTGSIVNNCTSEAENLPLSAKQGKVLMDLYTQLNSDFDFITDKNSIKNIRFHVNGGWMLYIHIYLVDGNTYAIGINTAGDIIGFINNTQKWIK